MNNNLVMNKRKSLLLFLSILCLFSVALAQPVPPHEIYGEVADENSGDSVEDVNVTIDFIDGQGVDDIYHTVTDSEGFYRIQVPYKEEYEDTVIRVNFRPPFFDDRTEAFDFEVGSSNRLDFEGDFTPAEVSDVEVVDTGNFSAEVEWQTDKESETILRYGDASDEVNSTESDDELKINHSAELTDLLPGTTYFFEIETFDEFGNVGVDDDEGDFYRFETAGEPPSDDDGEGEEQEEEEEEFEPEPVEQNSDYIGGEAQTNLGEVFRNQEITINYNAESDDDPIERISFTSAVDSTDVTVSVRDRGTARPSDLLTDASSQVYRYKQFQTTNLGSFNMENVDIRFRVQKEWVDSRNSSAQDIVFVRYDEGDWRPQRVSYIDETSTHYRYSAETLGFSDYAIAIDDGTLEPEISLSNVTVEPRIAEIPVNTTINGTLTNEGFVEGERRLDIVLNDTVMRTEEFTIDPGETQNFSTYLLVEEAGNHTLQVENFEFDLQYNEPETFPWLRLLGIIALMGLIYAVYMQLRGRVDWEELFLRYVGGEKERIVVDDGSKDVDGEELDRIVKIEIEGIAGAEPDVTEKTVYKDIEENIEYDWKQSIEEQLEDVEMGLAERIRKLVEEAKPNQTNEGYRCPVCWETFETESALHVHQSMSHNFTCKYCEDKFETERGLHIHQGMQHDE